MNFSIKNFEDLGHREKMVTLDDMIWDSREDVLQSETVEFELSTSAVQEPEVIEMEFENETVKICGDHLEVSVLFTVEDRQRHSEGDSKLVVSTVAVIDDIGRVAYEQTVVVPAIGEAMAEPI